AHANMIELYLLTTQMTALTMEEAKQAEQRALEHTEHFLEIAGRESIETYSTRRQMIRYRDWYPKLPLAKEWGALPAIAQKVCDKFPPDLEDKMKRGLL